ncbi:chemotaxis protein CheA [Nevskia ramosa]|uniref:chemotaxis protein CheA n=1 Tax=Nevskia ramosa TaxID=64002 RepID=UPI0003B42FC3|nr:chemotaxis protein CheA [Nevskia ramosa]
MSGIDDDIRADFLIEAGELLDRLGEQLVDLERTPDDRELLNAVFRAFHTVKGGAGFLNLTAMVALCHIAEEVFGMLRAGQRQMTPELMDATMQSLDQLVSMMAEVAAGNEPTPAPEALLAALRAHAKTLPPAAVVAPKAVAPKPKARKPAKAAPAADPVADPDGISDDEFEALLDQLHGTAPVQAVSAAPASDTISEDEFEKLLDLYHGNGAPGAAIPVVVQGFDSVKAKPATEVHAKPSPPGRGENSTAPTAETTVRVDTTRLDQMMNLVGELVLVRNRLKTLRGKHATAEAFAKSVGELDHITRSLQDAVMKIRMQPIKKVFSKFPKLARDVARGLGKQVDVELIGEDTDLDKNLVEALADPLVHMVRNSVDHGIELPAARAAAGKPAIGKLVLAAVAQGDHILISVRDDGAGIDPEKLRRKVVEKGLMEATLAARLTSDECLQLVFMAGFSTKEQVSDLSGRGVGMDVVKSKIVALNGSVSIESKIGQGSCVKLRVPLTLAILPALMVAVGQRLLALPLADVFDVFALDETRLRRLDQWQAVLYRNTTLRLIDLQQWSNSQGPSSDAPRHVVVAQANGERYGFIVHTVKAREEVVIKPLGLGLRGLAGLAGATVTGEGRVALIVDFPGLVRAWSTRLHGTPVF